MHEMTNDIKRIALVTGAAQGLGFSIASELAAQNYQLVLLDRQQEQLAEAVRTLQSGGYSASGELIDLAETEKMESIVSRIYEKNGPFHLLVNNAGVNFVKPFDQVTSHDWDFVMNINLKAVFFLTQAAVPYFADGGAIVNISSIAANSPRPLSVAYGASKAGVISLTKTFSQALSTRRIRVNAVCPGAMETELLANMTKEMSHLSGKTEEDALRGYIGDIPVGRIGQPHDVAKTVAFLASDAAGYITGQALNVCGGSTVK